MMELLGKQNRDRTKMDNLIKRSMFIFLLGLDTDSEHTIVNFDALNSMIASITAFQLDNIMSSVGDELTVFGCLTCRPKFSSVVP